MEEEEQKWLTDPTPAACPAVEQAFCVSPNSLYYV